MMLMKELAWERMLVAIICQAGAEAAFAHTVQYTNCLLYTSDAADD